MKTLLLIRHAEAGWGDFGQSDVSRTLTKRGMAQADEMAQCLKAKALLPEKILSSTATRAEMTSQRLFDGLPITWDASLYLAEPEYMLENIRETPDDIQSLAMVAHNPGISELVHMLLHESVQGMSPCTVVAITWHIEQWQDASLAGGELQAYLTVS